MNKASELRCRYLQTGLDDFKKTKHLKFCISQILARFQNIAFFMAFENHQQHMLKSVNVFFFLSGHSKPCST